MPEPAPRKRYPAEEARRRILEAARKRLSQGGPDGLRLQEIAADLGISHPAILHHFGSREGLLRELAGHSARELNAELSERIAEGASSLGEILERVREALAGGGQARLLAWLALTDRLEAGGPRVLADLVEVSHARREANAAESGDAPPEAEDTAHLVTLIALSAFADALLGDVFRASVGLDGPGAEPRFREWLADLLVEHMARGRSSS